MIEVVYGPAGGVWWIDAERDGHTVSLGGMCRYWISGGTFGGYGCHLHPEVGQVAFRWDGRWVRTREAPPAAVAVLEGEWADDTTWKQVRRG